MTIQVQTKNGLIDRDQLEIIDAVRETDDARIIETIWMHQSEEVRRDVTISILRGIDLGSAQGV